MRTHIMGDEANTKSYSACAPWTGASSLKYNMDAAYSPRMDRWLDNETELVMCLSWEAEWLRLLMQKRPL
jgi:hypothetical protein